jgi:uncharacterized protein involved in type VI secretion and phage assembly
MADALLDNLSLSQSGQAGGRFAIAAGIVTNNIDLISEGRVQVKIPSRPSFEPWARVHAVGGSASRGFLWIPQIGDEVLVGFAEDDLSSAYILGGLWSTMKRPPATLPTDFLTKKVIKTGLTEVLGHQIEMDDAEQSITITTSTEQKIRLDPVQIELTNLAGTVTLTLDDASQTVSIFAVNKIELDATSIELNAAKIDMTAGEFSITSTGPCSVVGLPIKLN